MQTGGVLVSGVRWKTEMGSWRPYLSVSQIHRLEVLSARETKVEAKWLGGLSRDVFHKMTQ